MAFAIAIHDDVAKPFHAKRSRTQKDREPREVP
jgi:hypothetical protein